MRNKTRLTRKQLEEDFLKVHRIGRKWWKEWQELVHYGTGPSPEFRYRLKHARNFIRCFSAIVTELSRPYQRMFPPPDYQVPEGYQLYC